MIRHIKRWLKHWWQRRTRGFDDAELWNLDHSLAKLILPRLKAFKAYKNTRPFHLTGCGWDLVLDKMIAAFEFAADDERFFGDDAHDLHQEGLDLFAKHYWSLWD